MKTIDALTIGTAAASIWLGGFLAGWLGRGDR